jgi:hypothetical protein
VSQNFIQQKIKTALPQEWAKKLRNPPAQVVRTVSRLRDGVSKLHKNMAPASVAMFEIIAGQWTAQAVSVLAELGVCDQLTEGPRSFQDLADACDADGPSLYRLLRACSSAGVLRERGMGVFELTALGDCLRADHPQSMRDMAIFQGQFNWANWGSLLEVVKSGKSAVAQRQGHGFFEHLKKNPTEAAVFNRAMTNVSHMELEAIMASFDFSECKVIADIGGGYGGVLARILGSYSDVKGLLFDLPEVLQGEAELLTQSFGERCEVQQGSFFDTAPHGADTYFMKHILHDWADEECGRILKNIREVIPASGRLLIAETLVPPPQESHPAKILDLEMLVVTTGRERTEDEFRSLLSKNKFQLNRVHRTPGIINILEASPL